MTIDTETGPVAPHWSFGDRVRKCRTTVGMTQGEFAAAIGVTESSLAAWETDRAMPRSRSLIDVCKRIEVVTNVPHSWLLGSDEPTPPPPGAGAVPRREQRQVRHLRPVIDDAQPVEISDEALSYLRLSEDPAANLNPQNDQPVGQLTGMDQAA